LVSVANGLAGLGGQALRLAGHPEKNVGVEQDHLFSQSSRGVMGPTMSPAILTFPTM
jgi:hypothetical protein